MSGNNVDTAIGIVRYRKRALEAEKALTLYTKEMHELRSEYEKNMAEKDAVIVRLKREVNDLTQKGMA